MGQALLLEREMNDKPRGERQQAERPARQLCLQLTCGMPACLAASVGSLCTYRFSLEQVQFFW